MVFSGHAFPKRLAAVPIVAVEGRAALVIVRPPAAPRHNDMRTWQKQRPLQCDVMVLMVLLQFLVYAKCWIPLHTDWPMKHFKLKVAAEHAKI